MQTTTQYKGAIGAGLANPADLIKVQMQAASDEAYVSTWQAAKQIYAEGGWAGLYRGTIPTVQRAAILTATQLGSCSYIRCGVCCDYSSLERTMLNVIYYRDIIQGDTHRPSRCTFHTYADVC